MRRSVAANERACSSRSGEGREAGRNGSWAGPWLCAAWCQSVWPFGIERGAREVRDSAGLPGIGSPRSSSRDRAGPDHARVVGRHMERPTDACASGCAWMRGCAANLVGPGRFELPTSCAPIRLGASRRTTWKRRKRRSLASENGCKRCRCALHEVAVRFVPEW